MGFDFEKWEPREEQKPDILKDLKDNYEGTLEVCGDGPEADDALNLYKRVRDRPLCESKAEIQEFYMEIAESIDGAIQRGFYPEDHLARMMRLTLEGGWASEDSAK